jgi:hypothetical protein
MGRFWRTCWWKRPTGQRSGRRRRAAAGCSADIRQISLSVERKNFAQKLYLSEGYQVVDSSNAQSDTMVKDLARGYPDS